MKSSTVLAAASTFLVGNILGGMFVFPLSSKIGLRNVVLFSAFLLCLGTSLRLLIYISFNFVLLGQLVLGMSACFVTNILMQFCHNWFHPKNRGLYVSLANVLNVFGGGVGNTIPLIFVSSDVSVSEEVFKTEMKFFLTIMTVISFAILILSYLFLKEKPPAGFGLLN